MRICESSRTVILFYYSITFACSSHLLYSSRSLLKSLPVPKFAAIRSRHYVHISQRFHNDCFTFIPQVWLVLTCLSLVFDMMMRTCVIWQSATDKCVAKCKILIVNKVFTCMGLHNVNKIWTLYMFYSNYTKYDLWVAVDMFHSEYRLVQVNIDQIRLFNWLSRQQGVQIMDDGDNHGLVDHHPPPQCPLCISNVTVKVMES